jgi:hypothetical protein
MNKEYKPIEFLNSRKNVEITPLEIEVQELKKRVTALEEALINILTIIKNEQQDKKDK